MRISMPQLADLRLNLPAWVPEDENESRVISVNESGDALAVYLYDVPPDIATNLDDAPGLRTFYRNVVTPAGGALVEVDPIIVAGVPAVRTIFKFRLKPSGMRYIGSLTLPFESFSYVVKTQCNEQGTVTGIREAAVFTALNLDVNQPGWARDPYDADFCAPLLRTRSDDAEWDEQFPDHPLSKCRRYLEEAARSIQLTASVKSSPPFGRA